MQTCQRHFFLGNLFLLLRVPPGWGGPWVSAGGWDLSNHSSCPAARPVGDGPGPRGALTTGWGWPESSGKQTHYRYLKRDPELRPPRFRGWGERSGAGCARGERRPASGTRPDPGPPRAGPRTTGPVGAAGRGRGGRAAETARSGRPWTPRRVFPPPAPPRPLPQVPRRPRQRTQRSTSSLIPPRSRSGRPPGAHQIQPQSPVFIG